MPALSEKPVLTSQDNIHVGLGPTGENLSIMIPNYNGSKYIAETLESLKLQGDSIRDAQIMVLDNCSTDDSLDIVRAVWGDRVTIFQHPENIGGGANWNACLDRAERDWIHILHSDDVLLPGGYGEVESCLSEYPKATAIFGRNVFVAQNGVWSHLSHPLGEGLRGVFKYRPDQWTLNNLQFVSVLVSRTAVAESGYFELPLGSILDWNYWWRVARCQCVVYTNHCLGAYRVHDSSWTSTIMKNGVQKTEKLQQIDLLVEATHLDTGKSKEALSYLYGDLYYETFELCKSYADDRKAFEATFAVFREIEKKFRLKPFPSRCFLSLCKIGLDNKKR